MDILGVGAKENCLGERAKNGLVDMGKKNQSLGGAWQRAFIFAPLSDGGRSDKPKYFSTDRRVVMFSSKPELFPNTKKEKALIF